MYGTQALRQRMPLHWLFENDVKMYGTQAVSIMVYCNHEFEDDIKYMVLKPEPVCQTVYLV